jgi:hypothetical protein
VADRSTDTAGDDMTDAPTAPAVRTDESLEQIWDLYEAADRQMRQDGEKAERFEAEARHHKDAAISLREQAAELLRQADQADAAERAALRHAASFRTSESKQRDIAADHAEDVEEKVRRSPGREHPRVRRERAAQLAAQQAERAAADPLMAGHLPVPAASGTPAQGLPVVDAHSALAPPAPQGPAS